MQLAKCGCQHPAFEATGSLGLLVLESMLRVVRSKVVLAFLRFTTQVRARKRTLAHAR
jgi:hypothetical protein